jgi:hypothetical protein
MDDLLIGASNEEEMTERLITVCQRLAMYNFKIQVSKTKLFERELKVLRIIFPPTGKKIDLEKMDVISQFPEPTSIKSTQSFLGMLNYLGSFLPHLSTLLFPVFNLLKTNKGKKF